MAGEYAADRRESAGLRYNRLSRCMHPRRLSTFVLGIWLAGGVLMALLAWADRWQADRLVDHPRPGLALEMRLAGAAHVRLLFHHQAAEEMRRNYELWEMAQIALGSLFFLFLLFGTSESKAVLFGGLLMLALAVAQRLFLSPEIAALGGELDFLPPAVHSTATGKLAALQGFYMGAEGFKWLLQVALAARLIAGRRGEESERVRNYVNPINKANYRHVNR